jgi:hypothetical protein
VEPARAQAGQPLLGRADNRVPVTDGRPPLTVDVEGQEPGGLRRGGMQIAVAGHRDPGCRAFLPDRRPGAGPVVVDEEDRAQFGGLALVGQGGGNESFPEGPAGGQRPWAGHFVHGGVLLHGWLGSSLVVDGVAVSRPLGLASPRLPR